MLRQQVSSEPVLTRKDVLTRPDVRLEPCDVSPEILSVADHLFPNIEAASSFKRCKVPQKRDAWAALCRRAAEAKWLGGAVRYGKNRNRTPQIMQQIIKCAVEAGYFADFPSPRGAEGKESRLIPTKLLNQELPDDPRTFAPARNRFVELFARKRRGNPKVQLSFDPNDPVAMDTQRRLEEINSFNNQAKITFEAPRGQQLLDPTLFAKFIDSFSLHGRLYTRSRFGHQALTGEQRKTILINGEPSVELDYVACHCRIAYHELGRECPYDPYRLWTDTTKPQRALAKAMVNTAFNAKSLRGLVASCNRQASRYRFLDKARHTPGVQKSPWRGLKTGRKLDKAIKLQAALVESGLTFDEILPQMLAFHEPIKNLFATDRGLHFMRIDSQIALNVMYHLVTRRIPVLGIHDSFIVAQRHEEQLRAAMVECYRELLHFDPVIAPQSQKQQLVAIGFTLKAA